MHETGMVRDLVSKVNQAAAQEGITQVTSIRVFLGALSQFSPAHFREHFVEEAVGSMAEGASLDIEASEDFTHPQALYVVLQGFEGQS